MASDISEPARKAYFINYGIEPLGDICDIDPTNFDYDILCAGFPCQPFSQAGKQKGFDDVRGTMFDQLMRFVRINQPKVVLLENVPSLVSHDGGKSFTKVIDALAAEDYAVIHKILKCSDYGIPQMRKRLFIVAVKGYPIGLQTLFDLDEYQSKTTLTEYLGKSFARETAYTIRCGGKNSPIDDKHNWDGYIVDGDEYRLTIKDALKLQGFEGYRLDGISNAQKWKLLGNTIPTNLTTIIVRQVVNICEL
jgi:DNA (cytosine-5)-methyltransferase 1